MIKSFRWLACTYILVGSFLSGAANAGVINWSTLGAPTGNSSTISDLGVVTANGGNFMSKGRFDTQGNYWQGFGVSGIPTGEISIGESISIDFFSPKVIESFSLGFLWPKNTNMKDSVNEQAVVSVYYANGTSFEYSLQAISANSASWNGFGSVTNLSPADAYPNAAVWSILNPFSNLSVSRLVFEPRNLFDRTDKDSDFSIMSVNVVPEPNTFVLLFSLFGFILMSRTLLLRK